MTRPYLAPNGSDGGEHRSLVLAGGGMRVAYQAGVLAALDQAGITFHHVDGTSGGTLNLSMVLAGLPIAEICERWRTLDPRGFATPLPWRQYVRSPHWPALGGSRGVRDRVLPHLGIDLVGRFEIVAFKPSPAPALAGFVAILFTAFEPDSSPSRLRCPTSAEEAGAPQAGLDFIFRRGALMI